MKIVHASAEFIGKRIFNLASQLGQIVRLLSQTFLWISRGAIDVPNTVTQMIEVGWRSSAVIGLTSLFTGMVLALQSGASSRNIFNEPVYVGTVVGFSLIKELGPVLTAIVVAGRVGAAIAAELGTMKVTEQLDALYTLGTNPVRYLAVPRFLACVLMVPLLTVMANVVGVLGGLLVTVYKWGIPSSIYWNDIFNYMEVSDFFHGFIKSFVFGTIIVTIACHEGFACEGGAEGVGKATTSSVMLSMVLILISDYFLTALLVAFGIG
jgi:phospholipid/cholesterol/gamma-HCH transport system permease protein